MHTCTGSRYQQLTLLERNQITAFLQTGRSQTEIAGTLNRSKSTISREIRREGHTTKPEVLQIIQKWLRLGWSPESISY